MRRTGAIGLVLLTTTALLTACGIGGTGGDSGDPGALNDVTTRAVSLGFEDVVAAEPDWDALREEFDAVDANAVHLAAGRAEWTAFPWPGHEERQSADVTATGRDYLAEAIDQVGSTPDGEARRLVLTVDALVPELIAADPALAGRSVDGQRSTLFASAAALHDGEVGDALVEMVEHLGATYRPDEITLTELMFDGATFGEDDLELYTEMTGQEDWPRDAAGTIETDAPAIGEWRSRVLADLLARMREATAARGVDLAIDVRASWEDPVHGRAGSGHDLGILEGSVDRFVVWNYFALAGRTPQDATVLTAGYAAGGIDPARITLSVGLWADDDGGDVAAADTDHAGVITPQELADGVRWAASNGVTSVSVTPRSLMSPEHWEALGALWAPTG